MPPQPRFRLDRDPEFKLAVARLRVALTRYRVHVAFDRVVREADTTERRKTDPRLTPARPRDPLTN